MAGGVASKGTALVNAARAAVAQADQLLAIAIQKGQVDTSSTASAAELAALVDPAVTAAVTALQAIQ